jgi:hypothetical protein
VWRYQQVDVIGHQHIAVNCAAVFSPRRCQPIAVARVVGFGKEDGLPVVATLNDMQRLIGKKVARAAPSAIVLVSDVTVAGREQESLGGRLMDSCIGLHRNRLIQPVPDFAVSPKGCSPGLWPQLLTRRQLACLPCAAA